MQVLLARTKYFRIHYYGKYCDKLIQGIDTLERGKEVGYSFK